MNSFIVAVFTVSGPIAEFVEMNTFFCPDTLYVIEGTSDQHWLCTYNREENKKKKNLSKPEQLFIYFLIK